MLLIIVILLTDFLNEVLSNNKEKTIMDLREETDVAWLTFFFHLKAKSLSMTCMKKYFGFLGFSCHLSKFKRGTPNFPFNPLLPRAFPQILYITALHSVMGL